MFLFKSVLILLTCATITVLANGAAMLAPVVPAPVSKRATFIGGWALGGGVDTCPTGSAACTTVAGGTCCPSGSECVGQGNFNGVACCPPSGRQACGAAIGSLPSCANSTWTLYRGSSNYFCCEPGQIGTFYRGGLITLLVGLCVPGDQNVPASNLATAVTAAASTATSSTHASTSVATTTDLKISATGAGLSSSSATASAPSATATKSAGVATAASLSKITGPILLLLGLQWLVL